MLHENKENHAYIYVLVRNDLSDAQKAVQSAHAAVESSRQWLKNHDDHPSIILCSVKSEAKLMTCAEKLKDEGVEFVIFREPDIGYQATAIASKPLIGEARKAFSRFQLLHANKTN
jgi:prephenate dehydratase